MKIYFLIFAVCVMSTSGDSNDQAAARDYTSLVGELLKEMAVIAKAAKEIDKIPSDPLHQVDALVESINELRPQNEQCVAGEEKKIGFIVDRFHENMTACQAAASKEWTQILADIRAATQQLIVGGNDVLQLKQKCDSYSDGWQKNACLARFSIKASLYLKNSRISMQTILKSTNERIPAALVAADTCKHKAAEEATLVLENIRADIYNCIAESLNI